MRAATGAHFDCVAADKPNEGAKKPVFIAKSATAASPRNAVLNVTPSPPNHFAFLKTGSAAASLKISAPSSNEAKYTPDLAAPWIAINVASLALIAATTAV